MSELTIPTHYQQARIILGDDFITPEEISEKYDMTYSEEQLRILWKTIPSKTIIEWCRDNNYTLVAGPSRSIDLLGLYRKFEWFWHTPEIYYSEEHGWRIQNEDRFLKAQPPRPVWVAIRKGIIPNSTNKSFTEQRTLLSDLEYVPNDAEVEWVAKIYSAVYNIKLFDGSVARTATEGKKMHHRLAFARDKLHECEEQSVSDVLGLASARKL
ncbi:hypothetical protein HOB10_04480 [Candidatus Parcubacteria bacterium]|jgi:hypothetical protein|nr:hypothetical protein [Candidatus Parcubacteria bacterium]